ncbi:cobalamin biosynthesis protein CbiX [Brevibacillus laterosporus]|uniref:Cobalamin biosynthesis protein CbiX n=1 Tax=Brevibacillus laterosporus TaxID=1465 RepID=A0A502ISC7_BRELA|nr:CbiX/SirB N-terminal domain-containing protein [Brevibacillus laterosporus]QDX92441.1 cobalamin biosynthesis protein CbiX [Brevibacillus laterosporus]RAP26708.1 hypothetical protein C2W64_01424 [Brevibacillus laterosporus]TPG70752.1 cobalamin biosynthesis protein CbiX [Brevibacillus laterosporus]TPG88100.1 cobalamin biosynthesis protein CbiX [Brevibacillus laterosporus]
MKQVGVLIIGHGSSSAAWVELVDQAVANLDIQVPYTTCFLEMVGGRLIEDGLRELETRGVEKVIAIPLFVAEGSTHIDEIGYLLGATDHKLDDEWERLHTTMEMIYCPPMNDHPFILDILEERIRELSSDPKEEILFLVGHGADEGENHRKWEEVLQSMTQTLKERLKFSEATYGTLHPDNLRTRAEEATNQGRTIVIPLFLSEGYFTKKVIPSNLDGLNYAYSGKTYLPHPYVAKWLQEVVDEQVHNV